MLLVIVILHFTTNRQTQKDFKYNNKPKYFCTYKFRFNFSIKMYNAQKNKKNAMMNGPLFFLQNIPSLLSMTRSERIISLRVSNK